MERFAAQVIAEASERGELLTESEIQRRAEHSKKAYFLGLALRSARVRAARKAGAG